MAVFTFYSSKSADLRITYNPMELKTIGFCESKKLEINDGIVNVTQSYHRIDTEGEIIMDILDTINGGNSGDLLIIESNSSLRSIHIKSNTGNLIMSSDFILNSVSDKIMFIKHNEATWHEVTRKDN
jgi:hypothetical protein